MKILRKITWTVGLMLVFVLLRTGKVQAAQMEVFVTTPGSGSSGDAVTATLQLNNNPGLTTFGVKVSYDGDTLTYNSATWASDVASNSNNMLLVSPGEESGQQRLNVSAVLSDTYTKSGSTFVTLNFTAKKDFSDRAVTVTVREFSDGEYNPVSAKVVYSQTGGSTGSSENTETPSNSESSGSGTDSSNSGSSNSSEASASSGSDNSSTADQSGSGSNNSSSDSSSGSDGSKSSSGSKSGSDSSKSSSGSKSGSDSSKSSSGSKSSSDSSKSSSDSKSSSSKSSSGTTKSTSKVPGSAAASRQSGYDQTYKTGAEDVKWIMGLIAAALIAGVILCRRLLKHRHF